MRLYLFLRSIVWTSVFSIASLVASIILALLNAPLALVLAFAISSVALATLSTKVGQ
jgi:hypothetical protein